MQNLSSAVLVALGSALVVFGGYHALFVAPQLRRLTKALDAHDALLGSGGAKATDRFTQSGDGVVISSIWSREETRTYGKAVTGFNSAQDASNEERAAIAKARAAAQ